MLSLLLPKFGGSQPEEVDVWRPAPSIVRISHKLSEIWGHFEAVFFLTKTIFPAKRSIFANHVIHIWKASPKTDGLRYFGTLFVHFMMRQIFGNTVQWDRYVNLILRCVLNHFFIPASLQHPTSKNYFNAKKRIKPKRRVSLSNALTLSSVVFSIKGTLCMIYVGKYGEWCGALPPARTYNTKPSSGARQGKDLATTSGITMIHPILRSRHYWIIRN